MDFKLRLRILGPVCAAAILAGCSSTNSPPTPGSPPFYWQAAHDTWAAGDYTKTLDNLDNLIATDNEFTNRALPWDLVAAGGLVAGYTDVADQFTAGAKVNRSDPIGFRRKGMERRTLAGKLALHFAENFMKLDKVKDENFSLVFPFPKGSAAAVPALAKVAGGTVLTPAEIESAQQAAFERGVLLAVCRVAGAPNDTAKAAELFKNPNPQTPRPVFLLAIAHMLYDQSTLYAREKLDDPEKLVIFCQKAQEALKTVPASDETKELNAKITDALKKHPQKKT
jgi:hypothetical protein